jgi:protein-arginine kinase activator protein McsA
MDITNEQLDYLANKIADKLISYYKEVDGEKQQGEHFIVYDEFGNQKYVDEQEWLELELDSLKGKKESAIAREDYEKANEIKIKILEILKRLEELKEH